LRQNFSLWVVVTSPASSEQKPLTVVVATEERVAFGGAIFPGDLKEHANADPFD
jgi:hypothetical protein